MWSYPSVMVSELVMVRHGLAHCNVDGVIGGRMGCRGLAPDGLRQATQLAHRLSAESRAGATVDRVLASPRRRTVETATLLAELLGLQVEVLPAFADQAFGPEWDGRRWSVLREQFGLGLGEFPRDRLHREAETWREHVDRVAAKVSAITNESFAGRVVVVAHTETTAGVLQALTPEIAAECGLSLRHAAMSVWRREDNGSGGWLVVSHDDVAHLSGGSRRD